MSSATRIREALLASPLAACIALSAAATETKLTDFNGEWRGSGTDRDSPLEFLEKANCRTRIRADLRRMSTNMTCDKDNEARKLVNMTIVLTEGNRFTGRLTETIKEQSGRTSTLEGTVSGEKDNETARFQVRFSGPRPGVSVLLRLINTSSYSMQVSTLGLTLTDVTFVRVSAR